MSKVVFLDPIDHVSGKLSKKSRVTYCYRHPGLSEKGEDRRYTQIRGKRSTPYSGCCHEEPRCAPNSTSRVRCTDHIQETPQLLVGQRVGKLPRLIAFGCVVRQGAFNAYGV